MSIELPEIYILSQQMNNELLGKEITKIDLANYQKHQKFGFMNKDIGGYDKLKGGKIIDITSRGSMIIVTLDNKMCLLLGPEYGGEFFYLTSANKLPKKYNIILTFKDESRFTGRLKGMGIILVYAKENLDNSYIYTREFKGGPSPLDDGFNYKLFESLTLNQNRQLKSVLVGKEAVIVGLMNSAFQDIIYRAKLHPKRKLSSLSNDEHKALFDAIVNLVNERIENNGKNEFLDLYQKRGSYIPVMGPNRKEESCKDCGTPIEKLAHGGGHVYLCPECQLMQ